MNEDKVNAEGIEVNESPTLTTYVLPGEDLISEEDDNAPYAYQESAQKSIAEQSLHPKPGIVEEDTPKFMEVTAKDVSIFPKFYNCLVKLNLDSKANVESLTQANILFNSLYKIHSTIEDYKYSKDIVIAEELASIKKMVDHFKSYHLYGFEGFEEIKLAFIIMKLEVLLYKITEVIKAKISEVKEKSVLEFQTGLQAKESTLAGVMKNVNPPAS